MSEKFWIVFGGYETQPTIKHDTKEDAIIEARRLAAKQKQRFYVCECIGRAYPIEIQHPTGYMPIL